MELLTTELQSSATPTVEAWSPPTLGGEHPVAHKTPRLESHCSDQPGNFIKAAVHSQSGIVYPAREYHRRGKLFMKVVSRDSYLNAMKDLARSQVDGVLVFAKQACRGGVEGGFAVDDLDHAAFP